jgi:hypothetical protein
MVTLFCKCISVITTILPVVLYGCKIWSLTLREEHRLRVFENGAEKNVWTKEG